MSKYKEIAYQILDELKLRSDDSFFQIEHILFLMDKFRGFLLKQRYSDVKKEIPESNFQTICLDLESTGNSDDCYSNSYLRSVQQIPEMMSLRTPKVSTMDYFQGTLTYVNRERFKYVGESKYQKNTIYTTIAPDEHLYLKSTNSQAYYIKKVKLTGVFEDSAKAAELSCDSGEEQNCDTLERNFPLEEALIPPLIELIVKELSVPVHSPADTENNANDDLSRLANYLSRNLKRGWQTN